MLYKLTVLEIYSLSSTICRKMASFFFNFLKIPCFGYSFADFVSNRFKSDARE
jgi:hypothetical protein